MLKAKELQPLLNQGVLVVQSGKYKSSYEAAVQLTSVRILYQVASREACRVLMPANNNRNYILLAILLLH